MAEADYDAEYDEEDEEFEDDDFDNDFQFIEEDKVLDVRSEFPESWLMETHTIR